MIKVVATGNLVRDPEMENGGSGACRLTVASRASRLDNGQPVTVFFSASIWGRRGETAAKYLHKGDSVVISGDYNPREYVGRDNQTHVAHNLYSADFDFVSNSRSESSKFTQEQGSDSTDTIDNLFPD